MNTESSTTSTRDNSRVLIVGALAVGALVILGWFALDRPTETPEHAPALAPAPTAETHAPPQPADPTPEKGTTAPARKRVGKAGKNDIPPVSVVTPVPAVGTRAKRRVWVKSVYGEGEDQLGIDRKPPDGPGETYPPQGFVATRDGDLIVLDSAKKRLVWFDSTGRVKRKQSVDELVKPADVALAQDGTLVVMDHEGVQTKGTLLLDAQGQKKGMLPQAGGGMLKGIYTVGTSIFGDRSMTSIKLGETNGVPTHETPGLYDQDGSIPGHVAPDGRTVISTSIESSKEGRFLVNVLRGERPEHLYTRQYRVPVEQELAGICFRDADLQGTIYVVLYYDTDKTSLLCLEGETGEPLGTVAMPMHGPMTGTPFREWSVIPEGGVVYQHLTENASTFEVYDCR